MKYHKVQLFPKSKLYFNLYHFETQKEMIDYARKITQDHSIPDDYQAICDKNIVNNRIGQLFFNDEDLNIHNIEHEIIHIILSYMRYNIVNKKVKINEYFSDFSVKEEEIASLYPYLKSKLVSLLYDKGLDMTEAKLEWELDKMYYKWDE